MIDVRGLSYRVGEKVILQDIDVTFAPGLLHAVIGPNGAGKSTLFKLMGQQHDLQEGTVHFGELQASARHRKKLAKVRAVLAQQHQINFPLKVWEVVMMGRYPHFGSQPRPADEAICEEVIQRLHLESFADRNFLTLSGGEKQRVHFARIFAQIWDVPAQRDRFLLLDEPLTFLDIKHQLDFFRLVRSLLTDATVIVIILHDINLAMNRCDRVHVLHEGRLAGSGPARQVLTPALLHAVFEIEATTVESDGNIFIMPGAMKEAHAT